LLSSSSWKRDVINLGGVTDSYQPAESKYKIMPEILKLLIRYRTPCIISTKSSLILRDYDLISQLAKITYVNIASTITTTDESIRRKIEPGGTGIVDRIAVLKEFSKTKASTGLHFMPIIPYLTDSPDNIESIYSAACDADVKYLLPGVLYLRGETRGYFFNFIKKKYPDLYKPLIDLYKTGSANKKYKENLYKNIYRFKDKYRVSHDYSRPEWKQPLLFPTL
jgi:DNA repair photolyase